MLFEKKIIGLYRQKLFSRCDDMGLARYFTHEDFPGLEAEAFSFVEDVHGNTLHGNFYAYPGCREDKIVVFDHGMGGGHLSYMREIERLCRAGYRVCSYDHSGCMTSEGENTGGFGRSLSDLECCIRAIKAEGRYTRFSVVGHSWGAYSTLNICSLHPDVESIVAISGFTSVRRMLKQTFSGLLSPFAEKIYTIEREANPKTAECDAVGSLASFEGKGLIIHSYDDGVVSFEKHFAYMSEALAANTNVRFFAVNGKGHNPNYTEDAAKYLASYVKMLAKRLKNGTLATEEQRAEFVASFDWMRMTEQDETVWKEIINVLG